jgi:hypothetical protein
MNKITQEEIKEIERILNLVPPSPWEFSSGNCFDHWELWSDDEFHGYHMVHDDSGVPPDEGFIEYVIKSREIIERLLNEAKKNLSFYEKDEPKNEAHEPK